MAGRPRTQIGTFGTVNVRRRGRRVMAETRFRDADGRLRRVTASAASAAAARARPARGPKTVALAAEISDGVLLDSVADADDVRRAREQMDAAPGASQLTVYTELDPAHDPASLSTRLADRAALLGEAGADTVAFQATADHPDPRPLIEAISSS